jgi:hypothetical protein
MNNKIIIKTIRESKEKKTKCKRRKYAQVITQKKKSGHEISKVP